MLTANDSANERTIKIWDVQTGEELITLDGHRSRIEAIEDIKGQNRSSFLPSGGDDRTLKVWKTTVASKKT